jgi:acetylornithine aminotransferase
MTGRNTQDLDRYGQAAMGLFSPELVLDHGLGAHVWDVDGREYLDLLAGIAVNAVGHAHPDWVKAVAQQAGRLAHVSNLYTTEPQIQLAETLLQMCGVADAGGRVFLANSGTEANEAALKLALRAGGGKRIVAAEGAFHGRTLGALSVTHKEAYRRPFHDFTGQVDFLPFGDLAALEAQLAKGDVAALWLEPIQGEAGVRPLPAGYLAKARELTTRHGALLILDEIQSGSGRTGTFLASQNPAVTGTGTVVPDVVTLAKGLGGGFPIGACVAMNPGTATALVPGDHGTTFGGNPLACAAALAT